MGFRLASLFERHREDAAPFPSEVQLWGWATSAALATGLLSGALRGARLGHARGMAAAKTQGVSKEHVRPLAAAYMHGEMAKQSLVTGARLGLFVGCLLGVDVVALEYPALSGPIAPAIGAATAALLVTARRGATVMVSSVGLGALMGLSVGVIRMGLGETYRSTLKSAFPEEIAQEKQQE